MKRIGRTRAERILLALYLAALALLPWSWFPPFPWLHEHAQWRNAEGAPARGRGAGKFLLDAILNHPDLQNLRRWILATKDAHSLYAQFGFEALADPTIIMVKNDPGIYARLGRYNK